MRKYFLISLGLFLSVGFASIFYHIADLDRSEKFSKIGNGETLDSPQAEKELAQLDSRSQEIEKELEQIRARKSALKRNIKDESETLKVFEAKSSLPSDPTYRKMIEKVAMAIVALTDRGEKPFATIDAKDDRVDLHLEAKNLFAHTDPSRLRESRKSKLIELMASMPAGLRLHRLTIYQDREASFHFADTQAKVLESFLREHFSDKVEEIRVQIGKRSKIPGGKQFLLELSAHQAAQKPGL